MASERIDISAGDGRHWRVEWIHDTRHYDLETGKPEPETGDPVDCACCGRAIVVHVLVREFETLFDEAGFNRGRRKTGRTAIVGTACAKSAKASYFVSVENKSYWKRSYK